MHSIRAIALVIIKGLKRGYPINKKVRENLRVSEFQLIYTTVSPLRAAATSRFVVFVSSNVRVYISSYFDAYPSDLSNLTQKPKPHSLKA